jgi:hypothetical protein
MKAAVGNFRRDEVPRLGTALAFYTAKKCGWTDARRAEAKSRQQNHGLISRP